MTKYKATAEQWDSVEMYAEDNVYDACLLELRSRVEALEKRCEVQLMQLNDLQRRHHRLATQTAHLESEVYADEPEQHCVEALEAEAEQ